MQQNQGSPNVSNSQLRNCWEYSYVHIFIAAEKFAHFSNRDQGKFMNNNISHYYYYEFLHKLHETKLF